VQKPRLLREDVVQIQFDDRSISGKHTKNYGKSQFLMGKSTISMAIFNSYVTDYQAG